MHHRRLLHLRSMSTFAINFTPKATPVTRSTAYTLLTSSPAWTLSRAGTGLEKTYRFPSFPQAMEFVNAVAAESERRKHHPEWANVYDIVKIRWTTHRPVGLGGKDVAMAEFCDQEAERAGAVAVPVAAERGDNAAQEQEEKGLLDGLVEGEACGACARKSA